MERENVLQRLLELLRKIQERSGEVPVALTEDSVPLRDLPKFDSLLALEASVEIETELGFVGEDNLFFDDRTKRLLSVAEVVDRLCERLRPAK